MPLIVITGYPASGKTTRANDLREHFEKHGKTVTVISENDIVKDRNTTYACSQLEKDVRSALKGEVVRLISTDIFLILDGLNYIGGYRYELFCISKNCRTPQVTVQCISNPETAWSRNAGRPESQRYSRPVFDALVARYEEPNDNRRWDKPLVVVQPDEQTPADQILAALEEAPKPKPNQSTQNPILAPTNYLYELDQQTQSVVQAILLAQKSAMEGDTVAVSGSQTRYQIQTIMTLPQLSRLRRNFVTYLKSHPAESAKIPTLFVEYLNKTAT